MLYHINNEGNVKPCRAQTCCPFQSKHYATAQEARQAYEEEQTSFNVTTRAQTPSAITPAMIAEMDEMQQRLIVSSINRLRFDESYSNSEVRQYWQTAYDSTPAGQLELKRRNMKRCETDEDNREYVTRNSQVERFLSSNDCLNCEVPENPALAFDTVFAPQSHVFSSSGKMINVKLNLAHLSAAWMTVLSPEEIEAVAWMTSNGSDVVHKHLNGNEHEIWGHDMYSEAHIDEQIRLFRSAMVKAPELDEPVIIYRGTGVNHAEFLHLDRPASASASGSKAKNYDNGEGEQVLLEIKTRKIASVVGMSAWGTTELEVLAPLGHYRVIDDFIGLRGSEIGNFRKQEIEPSFDTVRIIQMEYVGP